jgi:16S rRNA (uracil1498-N3)-methyltransferase
MKRRVHVRELLAGPVSLDSAAVRHIRDVLRSEVGQEIELFDTAGRTADGRIIAIGPAGVDVSVGQIGDVPKAKIPLIVAAAIPKGDRADWMVEKLSELGVDRLVPLQTARGVVIPGGKNKFERWERIAVESAKQSRRTGVMRIEPMVSVPAFLKTVKVGLVLSTEPGCQPIGTLPLAAISSLMIGPEGGWTDDELSACREAGVAAVALTATVLRVETAAVVAAGVVLCSRSAGTAMPDERTIS